MKKFLISLLLVAACISVSSSEPVVSSTSIAIRRSMFLSEEKSATRISNIKILDNRYADENTIIIGHRYWQIIETKKSIFPLARQLNNLVRLYHYQSNFEDKEFQGEVFLRIYDLEKQENAKTNREQLYQQICHSFLTLNDSIISWKKIDTFKPFPAFEYSFLEYITQEEDNSYKSRNRKILVILGNDRAYFFDFISNILEDKSDFEVSCKDLVNDVDINTFYQEEQAKIKEEKEKKELSEERIKENSIVLVFGLLLFIFASCHIKKKNIYARKWAIYTIILYLIGFLAMGADILLRPYQEDTQEWLWLCYVPSVILNSLIIWYHKKKSAKDYYEYYLIPDFIFKKSLLNLTTNFKKRIFMVSLIYPFFIIVPIPVAGLAFFICYIIPICILIIVTQGIWHIISWVKEGKTIDNQYK